MNKYDAKRVDSIYRNFKQLPTLGCIGFIIPFIGVINLLIAVAYYYLRLKLLRDVGDGQIEFDANDKESDGAGGLSNVQKIEYIRKNGDHLLAPLASGLLWVIFLTVLVINASQ